MYCTISNVAFSSHKVSYRKSFIKNKYVRTWYSSQHCIPPIWPTYSELLAYIGSLEERRKKFKFKPDGPYHIGGLEQLIYSYNLFKHLPGEALRQNLLPPPAIFGPTKSKVKSFYEIWNSSHWFPGWCHFKSMV